MPRQKRTISAEAAYNMPFPTRLRELLSRPGESQQNLASFIGANRQSVGMWKDGATAPDINTLGDIAAYYKVSADYLLGRIDVKSPEITIMAISKQTGLAQEAIALLSQIIHGDWMYHANPEHVNNFLSDPALLILFQDISNYLEYASQRDPLEPVSDDELDRLNELAKKNGNCAVLKPHEYGFFLEYKAATTLGSILHAQWQTIQEEKSNQ